MYSENNQSFNQRTTFHENANDRNKSIWRGQKKTKEKYYVIFYLVSSKLKAIICVLVSEQQFCKLYFSESLKKSIAMLVFYLLPSSAPEFFFFCTRKTAIRNVLVNGFLS